MKRSYNQIMQIIFLSLFAFNLNAMCHMLNAARQLSKGTRVLSNPTRSVSRRQYHYSPGDTSKKLLVTGLVGLGLSAGYLYATHLYNHKAIMQAAQNGNLDKIKKLISIKKLFSLFHYDINDNMVGRTALIEAAARGDVKMMEYLISIGANISIQGASLGLILDSTEDDTTPLIEAARRGIIDAVSLLIINGANVNWPIFRTPLGSTYGITPLMCAANAGHLNVVKLLVENGALIDVGDENGITAIIRAAMKGHAETVKYLAIETHACFDKVIPFGEHQGFTALMLAAKYGHIETVKALLELGARIPDDLSWLKNNEIKTLLLEKKTNRKLGE